MNKKSPILFSTDMVQAILEGKKTQTRRLCKYGKAYDIFHDGKHEVEAEQTVENMLPCRFKPQMILWVRETWQHTKILNINPEDENYGYVFKASENGKNLANNIIGWTWKPSIFMPKEASRIHLAVTSVRCERLQDISGEDALKEGVKVETMFPLCIGEAYRNYALLWDKINGKGFWDKNPMVWVIEFVKIPF